MQSSVTVNLGLQIRIQITVRSRWVLTEAMGDVYKRQAGTLFDKVTDTIREAALMADARKLNPERLAETSRAGLNEIFGIR